MEGGRREAGYVCEPVRRHGAPGLLVCLERVGDLVQTHDGAGFADRQVQQVPGDLAPE
jgi:hypothetical protein